MNRSEAKNTRDRPIIGKNFNRPVEMYLLAALVYFVICFSLSMLVRQLQKRIAIIR